MPTARDSVHTPARGYLHLRLAILGVLDTVDKVEILRVAARVVPHMALIMNPWLWGVAVHTAREAGERSSLMY